MTQPYRCFCYIGELALGSEPKGIHTPHCNELRTNAEEIEALREIILGLRVVIENLTLLLAETVQRQLNTTGAGTESTGLNAHARGQ